MEINIDDLQEKLDESNAIEPPRSMNELMERIYQAGELWREEHAETVGKKDGLGVPRAIIPPLDRYVPLTHS